MEDWKLRPAGDHGLTPGERLRSLKREAGLLGAAAHLAWGGLVRGYLALFHRLRVEGRENLPPQPPFVLIANHSSHLDALILETCVPARLWSRTFPIAAGDTFFEDAPTAAFAATALNALPMWRRTTRPEHLATLRQRLTEEGCVYELFPEGTRARDGTMARFKPGLGAIIAGTSVPVVPCRIDGAWRAFPPQAKWPRPLPVSLRIGAPLAFADVANDKRGWVAIAAALEEAVRGLSRQ